MPFAVNSSLTIQPEPSFQLVQRSAEAPASASLARTAAPKVMGGVVFEGAAQQHGDREGLRDDVLALGEHGSFEALTSSTRAFRRSPLRAPTGRRGYGLDLPGAGARGASSSFAVATCAARLGAQHLVEREGEAFAGLRRHDEDVIFGPMTLSCSMRNTPPICGQRPC